MPIRRPFKVSIWPSWCSALLSSIRIWYLEQPPIVRIVYIQVEAATPIPTNPTHLFTVSLALSSEYYNFNLSVLPKGPSCLQPTITPIYCQSEWLLSPLLVFFFVVVKSRHWWSVQSVPVNQAERCSVCSQWIPTSGGVHTCPGVPKKPDPAPKSDSESESDWGFDIWPSRLDHQIRSLLQFIIYICSKGCCQTRLGSWMYMAALLPALKLLNFVVFEYASHALCTDQILWHARAFEDWE